jgi:serine/threonine-protein kinase
MGEVYEAEHLRVGNTVALKFMNGQAADDARALDRFRSEVRALSAITSEHVVRVLDCGDLDGDTPYVVMERLRGDDLRRLLAREAPLSVFRGIRIALDACAGLSAVHAAGLVHRDLKPANLFVTQTDTRGELCKILDFGVAKRQASDATGHGALIGTIRYMAPEQLTNSAAVTAMTDVYALGAILFECLTGRPARNAESPEELMFDILNRDPPAASDFRPELPAELVETIARATSRRPTDRFQSVAELAHALEPFLHTPDSDATACDASQLVRDVATSRRKPRRARPAIALGIALGGAAFGFALSRLWEGSGVPFAVPSLPVAQASTAEPRSTPTSTSPRGRSGEPPDVAEPPASVEPRNVSDATLGTPAATRAPARSATLARPPAPSSNTGRTPPSAPGAVVLDVQNPYE